MWKCGDRNKSLQAAALLSSYINIDNIMMNNAVFASRAGATRGSENGLVTSPPTLVNANVDRK